MNDPIAAAYARRILRGNITINDVPEKKREIVKTMLEDLTKTESSYQM